MSVHSARLDHPCLVSRENPREVVGYLGGAAVMKARLHRHREEHEREPGRLQGPA